MTRKYSEWFPGNVSPVHPGVYQIEKMMRPGIGGVYRRWSGKAWYYGGYTIASAQASRQRIGLNGGRKWRGLAKSHA